MFVQFLHLWLAQTSVCTWNRHLLEKKPVVQLIVPSVYSVEVLLFLFTLPYDSLCGFLWTCMEFTSVIGRESSSLSLAFLGDEMSRVVVRILHAVVPILLPSALYSIVSAVCTETLLTITPHSHFFHHFSILSFFFSPC